MTDDSPAPLGDLPPGELRSLLHQMADWVADYREKIGERPISPSVAPGEIAAKLEKANWHEPTAMPQILAELDSVVMPGVMHWGHPRFLGYFGSTSNGPALLAEVAAAALNVSAMMWKTSPSATEMETVVLGWIREMIGLPEQFFGVVYDSASVSTLHALAAARSAAGGDTDVRGSGIAAGSVAGSGARSYRIYTSEQAHSSVEKAAIMLGVGERNVVRVATDDRFRMDVNALRAAMDADVSQGLRAMAVVATVGTTSTASVDPVEEIARLCHERGVWLHVDAAYGGALAVLPEGRWAMRGAELADSVVINPHKWLFVPLDFSALYTRRPDVLKSVFAMTPEYLEGDASLQAGGSPDYMDYGIQLGRRFRALKAWMVLRAFGRSGIESRIRECVRLARLIAAWVEAEREWRVGAGVDMGVVCFRYVPDGVTEQVTDELNERIVETINANGDAYLTHTRLGSRTFMRIGIGNLSTTEADVAGVWSAIRAAARECRIR